MGRLMEYKTRIITFILALFFLLFTISCSQKFSNTHKLYDGAPGKSESVGYVQIGESFMLTRAAFFAEKLNIHNDSIYNKLEVLTDSIFLSEFSKQENYSNVSLVSKKEKDSFSKETLKMDNTIFIKTKFPEQGREIPNIEGEIPNYLFIINEYTIGGDLNAENFYDYTKANLEISQKKKFKELSIIVTFTLWDNKKQIPLKSSIVNSQTKIEENSFNMNNFIEATKKTVALCLKEL